MNPLTKNPIFLSICLLLIISCGEDRSAEFQACKELETSDIDTWHYAEELSICENGLQIKETCESRPHGKRWGPDAFDTICRYLHTGKFCPASNVSHNLNTDERQAKGGAAARLCFEPNTPGAPWEDKHGWINNFICPPNNGCVFRCFFQLDLGIFASVTRQRQSASYIDFTNGIVTTEVVTRCREESLENPGTWEPWTDWRAIYDY